MTTVMKAIVPNERKAEDGAMIRKVRTVIILGGKRRKGEYKIIKNV